MPYAHYAIAEVSLGDERWYRAYGFAGETCVWRSFWRSDRDNAEKAGKQWLEFIKARNQAGQLCTQG